MSHDHPIMQHLQGLLSGTIPMNQDTQSGAMGAPVAQPSPYTDHAMPLEPGVSMPMAKNPPSPIAKTAGGFAGTSPLQLGGMANATPASPMQVSGGGPSAAPSPINTDGAPTAHPNGMSFGDSMAKLMSGGLPGLSGLGQPQIVQPAPMRPGNFNYMDVLSNTQKAMPQRDQWKTAGPY